MASIQNSYEQEYFNVIHPSTTRPSRSVPAKAWATSP